MKKKERRGFFKILFAMSTAIIFFRSNIAKAKKIAIKIDTLEKLKKIGGFTLTKIKGQSVILIRDTQKSIQVLESTCTHKKCDVYYNPKDKNLHCKCHKSMFDINGKNLSGPAPKPLRKFKSKLYDNKLLIKFPN